jgi:flagellar hook protein FlgE
VAPLAAWDDSNLPPPPASYNNSTSLTIYDSLGNSHELSLYFVSTGADREWDVHTLIDGEVVGNAQQIGFDESGAIDPTTAEWQLAGWTPANAAGQPIDISLIETTQYGSLFGVNSLTQDGYTTGQLAGVDIDASGVIFGRYTNGQSKALGQVALANFANPGGLQPLGDTNWAETYSSGAALLGAPGSASLGVLQSGALEESNVDLTQELVKLILAQRNFQANAQTIRAADTVTQTIINIR